MNRQIFITILIVLIVSPILWFAHSYSKAFPKAETIDKIAGQPLEYSQDRVSQKDDIRNHQYQITSSDNDIVTQLKRRSNPLYSSENVVINYNYDQGLFIAEVTTIRIEPAKREAVSWLIDQGISLETICTLPVTFTINEQSAKELKGLDIRFDPLPTECK